MSTLGSLPSVLRQTIGLLRLRGPFWGFFRIELIAVGVGLHVFEGLAEGPTTAAPLAAKLRLDRELLAAWLALAAKAGLVRRRGDSFTLSRFSRTHLLSDSAHYLGHSVQDTVSLQGGLLQRLPDLMRAGERLEERSSATFAGALSSVWLEPFAFRVLRRLPVREPGCTVLDVGCGHGDYLRFLAGLNPTLRGVGVELTEEGAGYAQQRIEAERLSGRLRIVRGDARELALDERFQLCLLNNNLYYFHPDEWVSLFGRLGDHLAEAGHLAIQVPIASTRSDPLIDIFDLYMRAHTNLYGVPSEADVRSALAAAGFRRVRRRPLWPFGQWVYLMARR